jgi:hypothetical protein
MQYYFSAVIQFIPIAIGTNKFTIMKKLFILLVTAVVLGSCAKENVVPANTSSAPGTEDRSAAPPAVVANAFTAKFGTVAVRQWKLQSDGTWKAQFTNNAVAWEAIFKADGTLIKSEASR